MNNVELFQKFISCPIKHNVHTLAGFLLCESVVDDCADAESRALLLLSEDDLFEWSESQQKEIIIHDDLAQTITFQPIE